MMKTIMVILILAIVFSALIIACSDFFPCWECNAETEECGFVECGKYVPGEDLGEHEQKPSR